VDISVSSTEYSGEILGTYKVADDGSDQHGRIHMFVLWKAEEHEARSWGTKMSSIEGAVFRDQ
jgi:hypothetical protein